MDRALLEVLKAFADVPRLRVIGALARSDATLADLVAATDLTTAAVNRQLGLLRHLGLVSERVAAHGSRGSPAVFSLRLEAINDLGRRLAALDATASEPDETLSTGPDGEPLPADDAKVLRSFIHDGRLTAIPAQDRKRIVVLRYLRDRVFTEDRAYPEKEVNQRLALFHPDVASLRRYMVDSGLVTRAAGEYRRA